MTRFPLSCVEAARMISAAREAPLPRMTRIGLSLHLIACRHCARYRRQLGLLHSWLREYPGRAEQEHEQLPEALIKRIVEQLRRDS
jgi:hypothetical protein